MTATAAGFKTLFPEFSTVADDRVTMFIAMALRRVSPVWFGDATDEATYYLTAHTLTVVGSGQGASGTSGPVTAESVGDVSVQYGAPLSSSLNAQDADLRSTGYGKQFLSLRAERVVGMAAMGMENAPV